MNDTVADAVIERLARLEERGDMRDARMDRIERTLSTLTDKVDHIADDVRDAKTGLRIGLWVTTTAAGFGGWVLSHFLPGK